MPQHRPSTTDSPAEQAATNDEEPHDTERIAQSFAYSHVQSMSQPFAQAHIQHIAQPVAQKSQDSDDSSTEKTDDGTIACRATHALIETLAILIFNLFLPNTLKEPQH